MVEVFKTNVRQKAQSKMLLGLLAEAFPLLKINFDLSDCDKILRVEGENIETPGIVAIVKEQGIACAVLD